MKRPKVITTVLVAWGLLVIGLAPAQAAPILPASPSLSGVTISIFQLTNTGYVDITDSYLPSWTPTLSAANRTVYVVVNGSTSAPSLVSPAAASFPLASGATNPYIAALTTSAYPGNCTNAGTDTGPDFTLGAQMMITISGVSTPAYPLVSQDCGGMAVIQVVTGTFTDKFVIPRDAKLNGIPDFLESFGVGLTPAGDTDGDGISDFDELRGFIVGGQQIRTNPTVKDTFVFLVKPQCGSSSLLGTYPTVGTLTDYLLTLIPSPATVPVGISTAQIHFLGGSLGTTATLQTPEWVDNFVSFSVVSGTETWKYCSTPNASPCATTITVPDASGSVAAIPATDRVINTNRVYGSAQRGLRVTECVDASTTSPFGSGRWGSPNGQDEALIYTQRMVNYVKSLGKSSDTIYYSTFTSGSWQALTSQGSGTTARNFIISKTIQYIFAMEVAHTLKLTPSILTTTFPHDPTGTGSVLDATLRASTSGSPAGVKFYIPSAYTAAEAGSLVLSP